MTIFMRDAHFLNTMTATPNGPPTATPDGNEQTLGRPSSFSLTDLISSIWTNVENFVSEIVTKIKSFF